MSDIKIIQVKVGEEGYPTNCYIIADNEKNGIIIDPGYDATKIIDEVEKNEISVKAVILTHCHRRPFFSFR